MAAGTINFHVGSQGKTETLMRKIRRESRQGGGRSPVFRVTLPAFHGRVSLAEDSMEHEGVGHLLADINVAD